MNNILSNLTSKINTGLSQSKKGEKVYLAERKETGERFRVMEIQKEENKGWEIQVELLKAAHHPLINPLYEIHHSESSEYGVFMEFKGATVATYLTS